MKIMNRLAPFIQIRNQKVEILLTVIEIAFKISSGIPKMFSIELYRYISVWWNCNVEPLAAWAQWLRIMITQRSGWLTGRDNKVWYQMLYMIRCLVLRKSYILYDTVAWSFFLPWRQINNHGIVWVWRTRLWLTPKNSATINPRA